MSQCRNCQTLLQGPYCPNCGQKNVHLDRPIIELVGDLLKETFEIDGRAARTLKTLFRHPGLLTAEFLDGKRQLYSPPLRLYLFISVAFFIVMAWVASRGLLLDPGQNVAEHADSQVRLLSDVLPKLMFVLLPVFAVLLKLAFFRRLYFDHLVFSLHLHSAAYVILALMLPLETAAIESIPALIAQLALFAAFIVHVIVAIHRVFTSSWFAAAAKGLLVLLGYMMVIAVTIEANSNLKILAD